MGAIDSLLIDDLLAGYRRARFSPTDVLEYVLARAEEAEAAGARHLWITRLSRAELGGYTDALRGRSVEELPLFGIPFVIKDNIDLQGAPTTAACPAFAYEPAQSATVVRRLIEAGAVPLGKTNLDQFATGLVGTRSPYGACRNSFDLDYISGGSSSGSAVAVALGLASFALGTDTAGSGRVPAAFNNLVGLKPSLGRISTQGVVPACRSLDCVSIFALTAEDATRVLDAAEGFDADDPYSRPTENVGLRGGRIGVPRADQLEFFGDREYATLFDRAAARARALGFEVREIDFAPLLEAARLLYEGPWVAERYAAIAEFMQSSAEAMHPVTRKIIEAARPMSAVAAFEAQYRLMALKRKSAQILAELDLLLCPTAGTIFPRDAVDADPIGCNTKLGYYTNFVNLLDLAAVAVPAGFRRDGLPFGVTLIGARSTDRALLRVAAQLHRELVDTLGATRRALPAPDVLPSTGTAAVMPRDWTALAVCGAHMEGLPLNAQLRTRGAYLVKRTRTAPHYRFYALPGGPPQRPGLVRSAVGGAAIEVEVWALRTLELGAFLDAIGAPLGVGRVELEDGERVCGFLCESYATEGALEITACGSWRAYLDRGI